MVGIWGVPGTCTRSRTAANVGAFPASSTICSAVSTSASEVEAAKCKMRT
jgi:hypothetical protein